MAIITNKIRLLRFLAGEMTQQELAERVSVTRQTILSIENGKYYPSLELAYKIAEVFEKPWMKSSAIHLASNS